MGELLANSFLSAGLKTLVVVPIAAKAEAIGQELINRYGDPAGITS